MNHEERTSNLFHEREIKDLKRRFCYYTDHVQMEDWLSLLTHDATISSGLPHQGPDQGHDELRDRIIGIRDENRSFMSHFALNPLIEVNGDDARGRWYFNCVIVFADDTISWLIGEYDDEYKRVNGEWKIRSIEIAIEYHCQFKDGRWSLESP